MLNLKERLIFFLRWRPITADLFYLFILHTDEGNSFLRLVGEYLHLIGGPSVGINARNGNRKQIALGERAFAHI